MKAPAKRGSASGPGPRRGTEVLTAQLEEKHHSLMLVSAENQRLHERLGDSTQRMTNLLGDRQELAAELSRQQESIHELRRRVVTMDALESKYGEVCALVTDLAAEKESLQVQVAQLREQAAAQKRTIDRLVRCRR